MCSAIGGVTGFTYINQESQPDGITSNVGNVSSISINTMENMKYTPTANCGPALRYIRLYIFVFKS